VKKVLLLAGILIIVAGAVFLVVHARTENEERARLTDELTNFYPERGDLTTLSTQELRVRYYATLHTLEPIMTMPGTDTEAFKAALSELSQSVVAAKKPYASSLSGEVLYPIALQQHFADTEDARRAFLASPSRQSARAYHESITELFTLYDASLAEMEHMLEEYPAPLVRMWQGDTDSAFVQEKVAGIRREIEQQHIRENERFFCLSGNNSCPQLSKIRSELSSVSIPEKTPPSPVPSDVYERRSFYEQFYALFRGAPPDPLISNKEGEPLLIELAEGRCSPNGSVSYIAAYSVRSMVSDLPALRFYILDDIYLNDVEKEQLSGFLPSEPKIPEEYRYTLQSPNYYTCIDYGYDAHMVLSMAHVYKQLQATPLTTSTNHDVLPIIEAVRTITESPVVRDTDMLRFSSLVISLYARKGPEYIDRELGEGAANRLLSLAQIIRTKSANLELMVGMLDNLMDPQLYERRDGKPTIDPQWFLITHAHMVSQYQLANTSVVPSTPSLLKTKNTPAEPFPKTFQGGIVRYEDVLKSRIPSYKALAEHLVATEAYIREVILKNHSSQ
jgi:hypothetical protein